MTVHTQYVFLKNKTNNIRVAFQNKEKVLYLFFLLLLKLLKGLDQEGCDACRWGKCFPIDLWQDFSHYFSSLVLSTVKLRSLDVFPLVSHLNAFVTARWGIIYSAKQF